MKRNNKNKPMSHVNISYQIINLKIFLIKVFKKLHTKG